MKHVPKSGPDNTLPKTVVPKWVGATPKAEALFYELDPFGDFKAKYWEIKGRELTNLGPGSPFYIYADDKWRYTLCFQNGRNRDECRMVIVGVERRFVGNA